MLITPGPVILADGHITNPEAQFFLLQRAFFRDRSGAARQRFEELGAEIIGDLQRATTTSIEASGISNEEIWTLWKVPGLSELWRAIEYVNDEPKYTAMLNLIEHERQNFYVLEPGFLDGTEIGGRYSYLVSFGDTVTSLDIPTTRSRFRRMILAGQLDSWSVVLRTMTGNLYDFVKIWRFPFESATHDVLDDGGAVTLDVWTPGRYEIGSAVAQQDLSRAPDVTIGARAEVVLPPSLSR